MVHVVDLCETWEFDIYSLLFLYCTFVLWTPLQLLSRMQGLVHLWIWGIGNVVVVWIVLFVLDSTQTSCTWWNFRLHLLWNLFSMMKMLLWKPCMAWLVLLPCLPPFLPFLLLQYIDLRSLEYCHLHICCLFPYSDPIRWQISSGPETLIYPYCFELDIKDILIFAWCS